VRLVDVPVALFLASEQHTNDLLREIALMAAARPEADRGHAYSDVLATADRYAHRPAAVRHRIAESVTVARRSGWDTVTVDLNADAEAADGALAWEELLQRFDAMSADEQLLTLPADGELRAYRAWYVRELVEQVRTGREPVSWERARHLAMAGAGGA
jgi:limonene-1,2-epoxide hydrolase